MKPFNKCVRCGNFFESKNNENICSSCKAKDEVDKMSLKNYLENNDIPENAETLSFFSGVSLKNLNRYLKADDDFSELKKSFKKGNTGNLN